MIIIHLKNGVEVMFKALDGDRLIPDEDNLEICMHNTTNEQQHIHCTCEPEDLKLYVYRGTNGHLIIPNHLIAGVEAITGNSQFVQTMFANAEPTKEHPQGFSLN